MASARSLLGLVNYKAIVLETRWLDNSSYNYPKNQLLANQLLAKLVKMLQSIKGVYKDGAIELAEIPENIEESQVIVTFLEAKPKKITKQIIYFGMFAGAKQSNENRLEASG